MAPSPTDLPTDGVAALAAVGVAARGPFTPLAGGAWARIWRVDGVAGRADPLVLRLAPHGSARVLARERAALAVAASGGVPVPELVADGLWDGRSVQVMTCAPGRTLAEELQSHPGAAAQLGYRFGEVHADLHAVGIPAGPARRLLEPVWDDAFPADPTGAAIRRRLQGLPRREDALLHLDFHPLNVLTDGERITAVVDWTNVRVGDPRAGIARTWSILGLDARRPGVLPAAAHATLGRFTAAWWRGYRARTVARDGGIRAGSGGASAGGAGSGRAGAAEPSAKPSAAPAAPVTAQTRLRDLAPFHAWAGVAMKHDLRGRREGAFFALLDRWVAAWLAASPDRPG